MAAAQTDSPYLSRLLARIDQAKTYPLLARRLGQTGRVEVAFTIRADGTVSEVRLHRPCPHARLNEAAEQLIRGLEKVEPLEAGRPILELVVPIEYRI